MNRLCGDIAKYGVHVIIIPGHGTIIACTFPLLPIRDTRTYVRDLYLI